MLHSSEWKTGKKGEYKLPKAGTVFTSEELIAHWKNLVEKYPIISIEDALQMKRTGKAGRSLLLNLVIKYSWLVMIYLLQIQKSSRKVLNLDVEILF